MFLKRKVRVTERPRSLNPSKAIAMAICPILVYFSTWRARSMHDVACEFARAVVRSKDAQKQLAQTSLSSKSGRSHVREVVIYKRFQKLWSDLETFGILENRSLKRDGNI